MVTKISSFLFYLLSLIWISCAMSGFIIHSKYAEMFHTHSRARLRTNLVQRCILQNCFVTNVADPVYVSIHVRPYTIEIKNNANKSLQ